MTSLNMCGRERKSMWDSNTLDSAIMFFNPQKVIYTNWRGETRERTITPQFIWYGESEYHKGKQWFLRAIDLEKADVRDFALADIKTDA